MTDSRVDGSASLKRVRLAASRGVSLVADAGGMLCGQSVILLHGGGQTRQSWGAVAAELVRSGCHVISVDLRGHGESDWAPDADYSLDAFCDDVEAMVSEARCPPIIIGASLGGVSALVAAGERLNGRIRGLVLVDVVPKMSSDGVERIKRFMQGNLGGFESIADAATAIASYLPDRPRPASSDGLKKNLRQGDDGRFYWHWDPAFQIGPKCISSEDISARMEAAAKKVTVPTALIRGGLSDVVSIEAAEQLIDLIPGAVSIVVDGAGHMVAGDCNDAFGSAIKLFIASLETN